MTTSKIVSVIALSAAGLLSAISARAAESYKFTLLNNSQYAISGFQTYENGRWSSWTGVSVAPGRRASMDWNASGGDCTVPFRILYRDVETEQYSVDWCSISTITVNDDSVTAE